MSTKWFLHNKIKNVKQISQKHGIDPIASVILSNREIYEDGDIKKILSSDINEMNDEKLLPDIDRAVEILHQYIKDKKSIRIVGDYDIDGVCSTYILYDSINKLGTTVSYSIPDRILDGYGINTSIIDKAIEDKIDLIITCDNGIAASEQIEYAKANNIEVIVTDHHDISNIPQSAAAVVNPKIKNDETAYPFEEICGAVVAWKFMMRYYELYKNDRKYVIDNYIEFAMLATIGDIMPLVNENHIIAKLGLIKIVNTKNKGLKKLLDLSGIDYVGKGLTSYHIGFIIGPLINAAGRMESASTALKLFLSDDDIEIDKLANVLKRLNDERKKMTEDGFKLAVERIEGDFKEDKVIVVFVEGVGEQVAGIIAGRIKDKYNKPTIVLTDSKNDDEAKASCRSIEAYDIFEALNRHKDMFLKFGGHKMAAGFSMMKKDIGKLRDYLNTETTLTDDDFIKKLYIDAEVPFYSFDLHALEEVEKLKPYGQGFQSPVFASKKVHCSIKNIYGSEKNIVQLILEKDGNFSNAVMFVDSDVLKSKLEESDILDIVYSVKLNEYRGMKSVDITVSDVREFGGDNHV